MQKGGPPDDAPAGKSDVSMRSESEEKWGDRRFILIYPAADRDDWGIGAADPAAEAGRGRTGFPGRNVLIETLWFLKLKLEMKQAGALPQ